ncbi:unnamed protein product, partial [Musa acuminata subsp. burmannicoides]
FSSFSSTYKSLKISSRNSIHLFVCFYITRRGVSGNASRPVACFLWCCQLPRIRRRRGASRRRLWGRRNCLLCSHPLRLPRGLTSTLGGAFLCPWKARSVASKAVAFVDLLVVRSGKISPFCASYYSTVA